ncbi:MAG: retroviral-like aspartic protease family protein [Candidatus Coatesbacteria bacterium]|nr:retroviral-like aspartic protease family protein [Candidatus Coatesbacteria bacterium]
MKMKSAGQQPKKQMWKTEALIDTGATRTCIRDGIAQELNLKRVASGAIYSAERRHQCSIYTAELEMGPFKFLTSIVGIPAKHLEFDCLLGRDLLDRFTLVYSGPAKQFWLIDGIIAWKLALPPESPPLKGNTGP